MEYYLLMKHTWDESAWDANLCLLNCSLLDDRTLKPYIHLKSYAAPTIIMLYETSENLQATQQHQLMIFLSLKKLFYYTCVLNSQLASLVVT